MLEETHMSKLSIHLHTRIMYQDLEKKNWWPKIKKEETQYVATYLVCYKPKIEHRNPIGMVWSFSILDWKWDTIAIYFGLGLPQSI